MQGLQTDSQDFCGPRLVVAGCLESFQNQHLLGLADSGADSESDCVRITSGLPNGHLPEAGRKVFGFYDRAFADNHGALESIAKFPHIARPGIVAELIQHRFADSGDPATVFGVHLRQ